MLRSGQSRRLIAIVAAYAIALQALLPAAFAVASSADFAICAGSSMAEGSHRLPANRDPGAGDCCGVTCCGQTLAPAPAAASFPVRAGEFKTVVPRRHARFAPPTHHGPQSPRAPPLA